jgi:cyanate permease
VVVGWLRDRTGSWTPALLLIAAIALTQGTVSAVRSRAT